MKHEDKMKEIQRQKAIDYLVSLGIFIPFKSLKLYHGRTAINDKAGEEWKVKTRFDNSSNRTGNHNVNAVSALSTSDYATAKEFADARNARAFRSIGRPIDTSKSQVHRIVSSDKDALIFNNAFKMKNLTPEEKKKVELAFKILTEYSITEVAPIQFEDRHYYNEAYEAIDEAMKQHRVKYVTYQLIDEVYKNLVAKGSKVRKELLNHVAGAINARGLIIEVPKVIMNRYTLETDPDVRNSMIGILSNYDDGPLSMEYFASWAYNTHIIGCKTNVTSVTVDKDIDNYMLFDTKKINTEKAMGDKLQQVISSYSAIDKVFSNFSSDASLVEELSSLTPSGSINALCKRGFLEAYTLDSGVWEKFLVGEHTETALRIFEDSFGDEVPESLKPFVKFVILSHDIGKGYANRDHGKNKAYEKQYTREICQKQLFKTCKINPQVQDLILFIISESQDLIANIYLPHLSQKYTPEQMKQYKNSVAAVFQEKLKQALGREPTKDEIKGFIKISKILLTCDGGAYTRYAITRDKKTGIYYRNGNDGFTASYEQPTDIRGREIQFPELGK